MYQVHGEQVIVPPHFVPPHVAPVTVGGDRPLPTTGVSTMPTALPVAALANDALARAFQAELATAFGVLVSAILSGDEAGGREKFAVGVGFITRAYEVAVGVVAKGTERD